MSHPAAPVSTPLPRRAVLIGAALTVAAPAAAGHSTPQPTAQTAQIEKLIGDLRQAISDEMSLEGSAVHEAAVRRTEALEAEFEALADAVYAKRPKGIEDLAARARIAEYYNDRFSDFLGDENRAATEVVRAILLMAGLEPLKSRNSRVENIPALIDALGGRHVVAERCGVSVNEVVRWERNDSVPPGWHHRFACWARKRGHGVSAELFGKA